MEASRAKPLFGATRHPVPDSRAEETGRQVGEAGRDTQVTFTFHEWASAKTTGEPLAQCLYRCSSVAQLNECGKARACSAATYSVIGTQLKACASNNTSSRVGNWAFYARICGTFVPEMTSTAPNVHDTFSDTRPSRNSRGLAELPFVVFTTLAEPGFSHANDHLPVDRQPV